MSSPVGEHGPREGATDVASGNAVGAPRVIGRISGRIAMIEGFAGGLAVFAIFCLLLANVISRSLGNPLIWTDELAVFLMAWVAFIGASLGIAKRQHIAVTLLPDILSDRMRRLLSLLVDCALLIFLFVLSLQIWRWFDPVTLWQAGTIEAFSTQTFNFIYQEPTVTLGVRKVWFWLVLPAFCVTASIHVVASLVDRSATLSGSRA